MLAGELNCRFRGRGGYISAIWVIERTARRRGWAVWVGVLPLLEQVLGLGDQCLVAVSALFYRDVVVRALVVCGRGWADAPSAVSAL